MNVREFTVNRLVPRCVHVLYGRNSVAMLVLCKYTERSGSHPVHDRRVPITDEVSQSISPFRESVAVSQPVCQ